MADGNFHTLLDDQNRQLIGAIQAVGLNPLDLIPEQKDSVFIFTYKPSSGKIQFTLTQQHDLNRFTVTYSLFNATFKPHIVTRPNSTAPKQLAFVDVMSHYKSWLKDVVLRYDKEINTPNRWKQLGDFKNNNTFTDTNQQFTPEAKSDVKAKLLGFEMQFAKQFNIQNESLKQLQAMIAELSTKLDKQSVFEWQMFGKGMIVEYIFNNAMNSEIAHQMFAAAIDLLKSIPYLPPPLLL